MKLTQPLIDKVIRDTAIISCYFNPNGYANKRENYERFADAIKSQGPLFTIECAFGAKDFQLPMESVFMRVHSRCVMWQKERLLNLLIARLPRTFTKVAWIDCDLLFDNRDWLIDASQALDRFCVVQLFELAVCLPPGQCADTGGGERYEGFGAMFTRDPLTVESGKPGQRHGHTGFAWAARRDAISHGLYDACISGNGDHLMAHAFAGNWENRCFRRHFDDNPSYRDHFELWCRLTYPKIKAQIGFVSGKILHLWHGNYDNRRYMDRNRELNAFAFNPQRDLCIGQNGCYEWGSRKPDLHRWADRYFGMRCEDGPLERSTPTKESLIDRVERARDRACSTEHSLRLGAAIDTIRDANSMEEAVVLANGALGIVTER